MMKIDRNTVASHLVGEIVDQTDSLSAAPYKADPLSVSAAPALSEKNASATAAAAPSVREKRSVSGSASSSGEALSVPLAAAQLGTAAVQGPHAAGTSEVTCDSLVGIRILAMRNLLGDEAKHIDDENLLLLSNQMHNKAHALLHADGVRKRVEEVVKHASAEDCAAIELSEQLILEETRIWLDWNGGESSNEVVAKSVDAYRETWALVLDPPSLPAFKTREELAAQYIKDRNVQPKKIYPAVVATEVAIPGAQVSYEESHDELVARIANDGEVKKLYFKQFEEFIQTKLEGLCNFKAITGAHSAGFGQKELDQLPEKTWIISEAERRSKGVTIAFVNTTQGISILNHEDNRPAIVQMPGNKFALLNSDGSVKRLDGPMLDAEGNLSKSKIITALIGSTSLSEDERKKWTDAIRTDQYGVKTELDRHGNPISLKQLIKIKNEKYLTAALKSWKESHYAATGLYGLARAVVPFFQVIEDAKNDPGFQLEFSDIAWDVLDLGITLGTIALSAGAGAAVTAGAKTVWSTAGRGLATAFRAGGANALKAFKDSFKLATFVKTAGKEMVDFVVPVFSVADLGKAGIRAMGTGIHAAKRELSDAARILLAKRASSAHHLTQGSVAGNRAIRLTDTRELKRYAIPSLPAGRDNGQGLWVAGSDDYAKVGEDHYRVAKDHATSTKERPIWKIQSPDGIRNASLDAAPVRVEFKDGKWRVVNDPPRLLGGAPLSLSSNEFCRNYKQFLTDNPVVNTAFGHNPQEALRATAVNESKEAWVSFVKNDVGSYDFKVFPPPGHPLAGTSEGVSMIPAYWIPDTGSSGVLPGFVDIPKTNPEVPFVFTGGMNGCALIVTQAPDPSKFRVWHARTLERYDVWDKIGVPREKAMVFDVGQYHHEPEMEKVINRMNTEKKPAIWSALNFLVFENNKWKIVSTTNAMGSEGGKRLVEAARVGHVVEVPVTLPA